MDGKNEGDCKEFVILQIKVICVAHRIGKACVCDTSCNVADIQKYFLCFMLW